MSQSAITHTSRAASSAEAVPHLHSRRGTKHYYQSQCQELLTGPRSSVVEREIPAICFLKAIRSIRVGVIIFFSLNPPSPFTAVSPSPDPHDKASPIVLFTYNVIVTIRRMRTLAPRFIPTATESRHGMPSGGNLTGHHTVHIGDLPYSDPVLRVSSSTESFSTEYGPDETSQSESSLASTDFARRIESTLRLHVAPDTELAAEQSPLLPPLEEGDERAEKGE